MANLVYNMVCDAFADLISRRAAENLVKEALRDIGSHPDRVTALEMQELLRKGIFKRLQKIIPVMKAKGEIKRLLRNLEKTLAQPTPGAGTEDSEDWDEPDAEAVDLSPWEVQTSLSRPEVRLEIPSTGNSSSPFPAQPIPTQPFRLEPQPVGVSAFPHASGPGLSIPVSSETGLDFLAVPLNSEPAPPERPVPFESSTLSSLPASVNTSEPALPLSTASEASFSPVARKDGEAEMSTDDRLSDPVMTPTEPLPFSQPLALSDPTLSASGVFAFSATSADANLPDTNLPDTVADSELVPATEDAGDERGSPRDVLLGDVLAGDVLAGDALEFDADLFGDAEDLFEFEATDLATLSGLIVPLEPKPALREYKRQDALLSRIALESGVSDVMLSLRSGEVLHARVNRAEPLSLAVAVAHAARPVEGGIAPGLFYADLDDSLILVSPLDDQVLLSILAASSTNIGRLLAEIIALKEEL